METRAVFDAVAQVRAAGQHGALATVIRVNGSAYRHEGAKLVVTDDGTVVGNVSGGCLEQDVIEVARQVMQSAVPARRSWCGGSDEIAAWDLGVGCEGEVEILVEPLTNARDAERGLLEAEEPFCVVTRVQPTGLSRLVVSATEVHGSLGDHATDHRAIDLAMARLGTEGGTIVGDDTDLFVVEALRPPPRLLVVSGADDAREVARLAATVGFSVTVADRRPGWLAPSRFPSSVRLVECRAEELMAHVSLRAEDFAVVMTHDFADDTATVGALLGSRVGYIGVLGPRARTARLYTALERAGEPFDARIHAPVGLDIGTDGAEQVALSIVAELLAVRSGRSPRSLRDRTAPIHASDA
jgi:xanthine/CO dehydrogenase XdhC/CoxF family maturation factor